MNLEIRHRLTAPGPLPTLLKGTCHGAQRAASMDAAGHGPGPHREAPLGLCGTVSSLQLARFVTLSTGIPDVRVLAADLTPAAAERTGWQWDRAREAGKRAAVPVERQRAKAAPHDPSVPGFSPGLKEEPGALRAGSGGQ